MSDYNAIADVGSSLIELLWRYIKNDDDFKKNTGLNSESQVTLSTPESLNDDQKLSLFLYQVIEDTYQKNQDQTWLGPDRCRAPSMPLSLFYLITPNTKDGLKDQILIGKVIQIFNDHRVLRSPFLKGTLAGEELDLIFNPLSIDDINKIWSVISKSKPYMFSVYYEVARVRIDSTHEETVKRVTEVQRGASDDGNR